jgi:hypothetical protein
MGSWDEVSAVHGCQKTSYKKLRKNNILVKPGKNSQKPNSLFGLILYGQLQVLIHVAVSAKKHI